MGVEKSDRLNWKDALVSGADVLEKLFEHHPDLKDLLENIPTMSYDDISAAVGEWNRKRDIPSNSGLCNGAYNFSPTGWNDELSSFVIKFWANGDITLSVGRKI